jgi:hypothetical protein
MFVEIPGFPNYLINDSGEVLSLISPGWKILRSIPHASGYQVVALMGADNKAHTKKVHRLLMAAWCGESKLCVNHIDGNKTNNILSNLEYTTVKGNTRHAIESGLWEKRKRKFDDTMLNEIYNLRGKMPHKDVCKIYNINRSYLSKIWNNQTPLHRIERPSDYLSKRTKISDDLVIAIFQDINYTVYRDLAHRYGVSYALVAQIKLRQRKAYITDKLVGGVD